MGKLTNNLQKQLKLPEHKQDAEDCITIYNWIKDTDKEGRVWSSRWDPLTDVTFKGVYPNTIKLYKLSLAGKTLLKGLDAQNQAKTYTKEEVIRLCINAVHYSAKHKQITGDFVYRQEFEKWIEQNL